mgnify:CR=1 FL=1
MIKEIILNVKHFYKICDKPTFLFALAAVNQVVGFTPQIPSVVYYAILILYAFYILKNLHSVNGLLVSFLLYVPLELLVMQPDSVFKPWGRYVLFALVLICNSPLLQGKKCRLYRLLIFRIILFSCAFLGIGSCLARFVGINYMVYDPSTDIFSVGLFGGLTFHSMLLGPIAGIGSLYMMALWYRNKKLWYMVGAVMCLFAVLFSASRSALMAVLAGNVLMLYKMSGTGSRFMKYVVIITLVTSITFPLWGSALNDVIAKNNNNIEAGGAFDSRSDKWNARMKEFKDSPLLGVGFASIDPHASDVSELTLTTGIVEPGSSWLCVFSMVGLIGALLLLPVFYRAIVIAWHSGSNAAAVITGVLTLFYVHMFAEGYVLSGGSFLSFCLWLAIGVAYDIKYYDNERR